MRREATHAEYPCRLGEATGRVTRESTGSNHRNENNDMGQSLR